MGNPQLEGGYIKISTELWEALMAIRIPGEARQILDCIIRKTYGWGKKSDVISLSQFEKETGITKTHVHRAIKKLQDMNVITQKGNKYSINKMYNSWRRLPKKVTNKPLPKKVKHVTKKGNEVTKKGNKKLPKKGNTINTTINTYTIDTITKDTVRDFRLAEEMMEGLKNSNKAFAQKFDTASKARPKVERWAADIDKMKRIDNVSEEQIRVIIQWLYYSDDENAIFWRGNIQSGEKLRKQFPRLIAAIEREAKKKPSFVFIS